jgi:hypothetical protein
LTGSGSAATHLAAETVAAPAGGNTENMSWMRRRLPSLCRDLPKVNTLPADQHEALDLLAGSARGCRESILMAHGFAIGMLHGLVRYGLVIAEREPAYLDRRAIIVTCLRITEAGRKALER